MINSLKLLRSMLSVVLIFLAASFFTAQGGTVVMGPYLQAVTEHSVKVMVESAQTSSITVEYGPDAAYGNKASTSSIAATTANPRAYVHCINLTGLQSGTLYHYRVDVPGTAGSGHTFYTASGRGTSFRLAFAADFRTGTAVHDTITARILAARPRFLLYGGDLCSSATYKSFKSEFFRAGETALIAEVPFFNAPGNHEGWGPNAKAFLQAPASASGTADYYAFDYGDLHVVVINNELLYAKGTAQYNFVADDLAKSDRIWKIVISHKPAYGAGGHGGNLGMRVMTDAIFEPAKVDMVISGHNHYYQHNLVNGIHHLTVGSAGAPLYEPGLAAYTVKSSKSYCYAVIDVSPNALRIRANTEQGVEIERIDLVK